MIHLQWPSDTLNVTSQQYSMQTKPIAQTVICCHFNATNYGRPMQ